MYAPPMFITFTTSPWSSPKALPEGSPEARGAPFKDPLGKPPGATLDSPSEASGLVAPLYVVPQVALNFTYNFVTSILVYRSILYKG